MSSENPPTKPKRPWRKVVKWTLIGLVVLAIIDVPASYVTTVLVHEGGSRPAYTVAASRRRGALVHELTISPSVVNRKGKQIVFKEVWLERRTELVQVYSIIPCIWEHRRYRPLDGYYLCFNLSEGNDAFPDDMVFVEGEGSSFMVVGSAVQWEDFDAMPQFPLTLHLTDNWHSRNSVPLIVDRVSKQNLERQPRRPQTAGLASLREPSARPTQMPFDCPARSTPAR